MAEVGPLVPEAVLEELLAGEVLEVGIVDPALADAFVGQAVDVLEQQQPDHEAGLDAGSAVVAVQRGDLVVDPGPVDLAGKLHQLVLHVEDLVEPGPEQITLSCRRALPGSHATLRCAANHGWTPRRIAKNEIARFRCLMAPHLAIPNPLPVLKPIPDQLPTSSSRATAYDVVTRAIVSQRATVSLPRQAVIVRKQHHHARW